MKNISYKEKTAKRGGILGFFKKHYMLATFIPASITLCIVTYFTRPDVKVFLVKASQAPNQIILVSLFVSFAQNYTTMQKDIHFR